MNVLKIFLSKFIAIIMVTWLSFSTAYAQSNLEPTGTIGEFGTWATEESMKMVTSNISSDLEQLDKSFSTHQMTPDYVPVDARLGLVFMQAMSWVGDILNKTLVRFISMFIILAYGFWIMLETYKMMSTDSNIQKLAKDAVKNGILIMIWLLVLNIGPAKLFMYVMSPILYVGTTFADMILNAITHTIGVSLPDTCSAIHTYTATHMSNTSVIDADMAANIMCLPTRMSGFFLTGIKIGFKWMQYGVGSSLLTFLAGATFVVVFAVCIWKFALMAINVIADLFLAILMLPLTAAAETLNKTTYQGIAGNIYNNFLDLFKVNKLSDQVNHFINASIYFVSLSVIITLCAALLSGVIPIGSTAVPGFKDTDFITILLTAVMVWYIANQTDKLARKIGGHINDNLLNNIGNDLKNLGQIAVNKGKHFREVWQDAHKK